MRQKKESRFARNREERSAPGTDQVHLQDAVTGVADVIFLGPAVLAAPPAADAALPDLMDGEGGVAEVAEILGEAAAVPGRELPLLPGLAYLLPELVEEVRTVCLAPVTSERPSHAQGRPASSRDRRGSY